MAVASYSLSVDLLSRTTEQLRLRRATYRRDTIRAPHGRTFDDGAGMYLVEHGRATIGFDLAIAEGDVILMPRGEAHAIEARAELALIVARFEFVAPDHPLLQSLPALIHIPAERLDGPSWIQLRDSLLRELAHPDDHPGRATMLVRLSDVLLIEAMRRAPPPRGTECPVSGLVSGAPDESLGRVLTAIHEAPEQPWTVAALAEVAGQSRSAFAAHFTSVMSEPPMAYLGRWRMFRARALLRANDLSLDAIAAAVGYGSAAAFSLAFTREHGVAPGAFRREAQAG